MTSCTTKEQDQSDQQTLYEAKDKQSVVHGKQQTLPGVPNLIQYFSEHDLT